MAYPRHVLLAFGGTLEVRSGQDEIWETTLRAFPGSSGGPASLSDSVDYQAWCNAVAPQLATFYSLAAHGMHGLSQITYVKANVIGPDGKYESANQTNVAAVGPATGGATTFSMPTFLSVCMSWTSTRVRGTASKGRMYWPNASYTCSGAAISSTSRGAVLSTATALIALIKAQTTGLDGGIMSPALVSGKDAAWAYITGARVGDIYDVQRRRKNAVTEQYATAVVP